MRFGSVTSLRFYIYLLVVIGLAPLLVLTLISASGNRAREVREFEQHALQFAEIVSFQEEEMLARGRAILLVLAEVAEVREVALAGPSGPTPEQIRRCDAFLERQLRLHPEYLNFGFADRSGRIISSGLPMPEIVDISDREYFQRAMQSGGFGVGVYQIGRVTHKPSINLGHAILGPGGDVTGVIYLATDLRVMDRITDDVRLLLPEVVIVSKLDRNGIVLEQHPREGAPIGLRAPEFPIIQESLARNSGIARGVDSTGVRQLYAFSRVTSGVRSGDAFVMLKFPEAAAFRLIDAELRKYLLTIAAMAVVATGLGLGILSFFVLRPARSLLQATARLTAGDLTARAGSPYGPDEVGRVSMAFDRMAAALQERQRERDCAEAALRLSAENYRSLVNEAPYGIIRATADGRILDANPAVVKMLGYDSEEELRGVQATDLYVHAKDRDEFAETFARTGGPIQVAGIELRRKDGGVIHARLAGRAVLDAGKRLQHLECIVEDETERRALELQLQQAQKMEAVGRLAGGIAHDFNNLLGIILGHSDLVLRSLPADDPNAEALRSIRDSASHGAALTRQLLGFGGRHIAQPTVLDLNQPMEGVQRILDRLIGENYRLEVRAGMGLPHVRVDPTQIGQVILNLVVNARDAMPEGGTITLSTEAADVAEPTPVAGGTMPAGRYVCLKVEDHGVGIPPEVRERIFEPFFTTKPSPRDTGLGLSIVRAIVTHAKGYVRVQSEVGQGTAMEIFLPPCEEAPPTPAPRPVAAPAVGTETVLLVEDEEGLQRLLQTVLTRAGYRVLSAANGQQALSLAEQEAGRIDLLVTDVIMPGMGGGDLADRLSTQRPDLKVLFISGYPDEALGGAGPAGSERGFLSKPFTADELLQTVRDLLHRRAM